MEQEDNQPLIEGWCAGMETLNYAQREMADRDRPNPMALLAVSMFRNQPPPDPATLQNIYEWALWCDSYPNEETS